MESKLSAFYRALLAAVQIERDSFHFLFINVKCLCTN